MQRSLTMYITMYARIKLKRTIIILSENVYIYVPRILCMTLNIWAFLLTNTFFCFYKLCVLEFCVTS